MKRVDLSSVFETDVLAAKAAEVRSKELYNHYSQALATENAENTLAFFSGALSRNPYQGQTFKTLFYAVYLLECFSTHEALEVVSDSTLLQALFKNLAPQWSFVKPASSKMENRILNVIISTVKFGFLRSCSWCRRSDFSKKNVTLFTTFLINAQVRDTGEVQDRYYPGMESYLNPEQRSSLRYLATVGIEWRSMLSQWKRFRKIGAKYLFVSDLCNFFDFFKCLWLVKRAQSSVRYPEMVFKTLDIAEIFRTVERTERFNQFSIDSVLLYLGLRNLKSKGLSVDRAIIWSEGLINERSVCRALQDFFPSAPVSGYAGVCVDLKNNLHFLPTEFEVKNGLLPKNIFVMGPHWVKVLKGKAPYIRTQVGPAFRFRAPSAAQAIGSTSLVFVCLPISKAESEVLVRLAAEAARAMPDTEFFVKSHPASGYEVESSLLTSNFKATTQPTTEFLSSKNIVISTASSFCVEAASMSIPVIVVMPRLLMASNPLREIVPSSLWTEVSTSSELIESLTKFRAGEVNLGHTRREDYFAPVTAELVQELLGKKQGREA